MAPLVEPESDEPKIVREEKPVGSLEMTDKVKMVGKGANAREVRVLSPEEKAKRRKRRSIITMTLCLIVLMIAFAFLSKS